MWLRLRHIESGHEFWTNSTRLSTGVSDDVTADEIQQVLKLRPPSTLPSILMADFNTQLRWTNAAGPVGQPLPTSGRADYLISEVEREGYRLHAPEASQWDVPTSRPRRRNARGRQIDGVVTKYTRKPEVQIDEGSFKQIGGDHERVQIRLPIGLSGANPQVWDTRPRVVTGEIPTQPGLNQTRLEQLAVTYTAPRKGCRYRDPPEVKRAFRRARTEDTEAAWKAAQGLRRKARDEWAASQGCSSEPVRLAGLKGPAGSVWHRVGGVPD